MRGAGGTEGGVGRFILGLVMLIAGLYLFLDNIHVTNHFTLGAGLFQFSGVRVTSGMVLIPFLFGVGMIFYDAKNDWGWVLVIATLVMLLVGVITSLEFRLRPMSAFELMMILGLALGGIGLLLGSLRNVSSSGKEA